MILSGTTQDLPLNLNPRVESDLMRLWEHLDIEIGEPNSRKLYFVQGIVPHGIAPVVQPPKEVDQTTSIVDMHEALVSFFTTERGADNFRKRLVRQFGYKDRELTISAIAIEEVMDLVLDLNDDFQEDLGISVRAEAYYVRNDQVVVGDVLFSELITKN